MADHLGDLLVRDNCITPAQLEQARACQRASGGRLDDHLVRLGHVTGDVASLALSRQYGVPAIALDSFEIDPGVVALVPADAAAKYGVIPISRSGATLTVAMSDPADLPAIEDLRFITGLHIEPVVAAAVSIREALARHAVAGQAGAGAAGEPDALAQALRGLDDEGLEVVGPSDSGDPATLEQQATDAPVIRLVSALMLAAVQQGASDIHFEPYERWMRVRFRIDGVLRPVLEPPLRYRDAITSRIKIMAQLDIAEKRLPQDGRIKARFTDQDVAGGPGVVREIDFRVSCLPTLFGEKIVLRLLDRLQLRLDMTHLGFEPAALARFEAAVRRPWGLVLVTGPTGSGKTNTLYSALSRLNLPGANILTVEDPIEFNLAGINQVQVREAIGLSFAAALRAFLRQDPNVILVGEIRDADTAAIAVKAALTGRLVLSTLHTNDAPSAVSRLINLGVDPFLVAGSLTLVCAQRLVRRICDHCREPDPVLPQQLADAGFDPGDGSAVAAWRGGGCDQCAGAGYKGRVGIFEVMASSDAVRRLIHDNAPAAELRQLAMREGMVPLRACGLQLVRQGVTTLDDVMRETVA